MRSYIRALNEYFKFIAPRKIFTFGSAPARMRNEHFVVHTREERRAGFVTNLMRENTEHFFFVGVRRDFVLMIKLCLCRPATIYSRGDIFVHPIHERGQFLPVVHLLKRAVLQVCARDDEPVQPRLFYLLNGFIERIKVVLFGTGFMRVKVYECWPDLERGVREQAKYLNLGPFNDLALHQIAYAEFFRTDILFLRLFRRHLQDLLALQIGVSRKFLVYYECHRYGL